MYGERRDRVRRTCCSHLTQCSEACTCLSTACAASHSMLFVPQSHSVVQCATSVAMSTVLTRLCRSALSLDSSKHTWASMSTTVLEQPVRDGSKCVPMYLYVYPCLYNHARLADCPVVQCVLEPCQCTATAPVDPKVGEEGDRKRYHL